MVKFCLWYSGVCLLIAFLYLIPTFRKRREGENTAQYIWRRREHAQFVATAGIFCPPLWILAIIYYLCTRRTDCPVCGGHNTVRFSNSKRHKKTEENWFRCTQCDYTDVAMANVPEIKPDKHTSSSGSGMGSGYGSGSGSWGGGGTAGGGAGRKF